MVVLLILINSTDTDSTLILPRFSQPWLLIFFLFEQHAILSPIDNTIDSESLQANEKPSSFFDKKK